MKFWYLTSHCFSKIISRWIQFLQYCSNTIINLLHADFRTRTMRYLCLTLSPSYLSSLLLNQNPCQICIYFKFRIQGTQHKAWEWPRQLHFKFNKEKSLVLHDMERYKIEPTATLNVVHITSVCPTNCSKHVKKAPNNFVIPTPPQGRFPTSSVPQNLTSYCLVEVCSLQVNFAYQSILVHNCNLQNGHWWRDGHCWVNV